MNFFQDILDNVAGYYSDIVAFLPQLVISLLVFFLFWWIGGRSKKFFKSTLKERIDDQLLTDFLAQITKIIWIVIGFLLFLKIIGWGDAAASLLATAGLSAFIIGFAFKDIGENFLAGIVMAFNRPFGVGDVIETNGIVGKITAMSLRETLVKTFDGKDVHIPNGLILKSPLQNYTIDGFLRFDFNLRLDYATDLNEAGKIILGVLGSIDGILKEQKAPDLTVSDLGSDEVVMTIYFWINTFDPNTSVFKIKKEVVDKCLKALKDAGIYMPHRIIELKNYKDAEIAGEQHSN